jgi:thiol-disulfide isomerase/thioredoxin
MAYTLVFTAVKNSDIETIMTITQNPKINIQSAGLLNNVAWKMAESKKNLELAEELSKKSLDILRDLEEKDTQKPEYLSTKQFAHTIESNYLMNVDTYAYILFERGKKEEALKYQIEAIGEEKIGRPDVNERYIQFLLANNKKLEALREASRFIKINQATPKIKDYLQQAYTANKDMEGSFKDYLIKLEIEAKEVAYAALRKKLINDEPFDFSLKNLKGEEVTLSNLKGKTVILDFWATWCGPCTASFPGMQKAVNKYKDDSDVVFLFVNTLEYGTQEEIKNNIKTFITENNYSFNVLFDRPVKEGSRNHAVTQGYAINGIPTKIIIGPDGRIKFKSVGSKRSPEQLIEELDLIIDLLKS